MAGPKLPEAGAPLNGGSAFPSSVFGINAGLSVRDYFAAEALYAILDFSVKSGETPTDYAAAAKMAFDLADAMLTEREMREAQERRAMRRAIEHRGAGGGD